ncbi:MAG: TldD/PmbA family protein [bacterium]|nr:TldD/PmbA family protein [bacterium]
MHELLLFALKEAKRLGAEYADIRFAERTKEPLAIKNGVVQEIRVQEERGFGVRVLVKGAWGFASSNSFNQTNIKSIVEEATIIAKASAVAMKKPFILSPMQPITDTFRTIVKVDPFKMPLAKRIDFLKALDQELMSHPQIKVAQSSLNAFKEHKWFASTEGRFIEQETMETGCTLSATAVGNGDVQTRSFRDYAQAGFECVLDMNLAAIAKNLSKEAVDLLVADTCPKGETALILGSSQLALQIHESCGHPIELDRVYGTEVSFAGTSFMNPDMLGKYQYGSKQVNIVADATIPGGLGTFGYDDEGVPAQRTTIIDQGLFVNYLTSRETAQTLGKLSNGTMRAEGPSNVPLVRMVNINLEPGEWTTDEIIRDTKHGIFMESPKSWSLDDKRLNFHFSTEYAYEIVNGEKGRLLKNPAYTDMTTHFWNACDAVAGKNKDEWHLWGMPSCAKGEPMQIANVAHGAAPARFRNIKVGVGK